MKSWFFQVFLMELRKLISYRADFWVNFFGQTFFSLTIAYYLWSSIFSYLDTKEMNGLTLNGIIFYYLIVPLIFRIQQGQGIGFISREIYDGSLTKYLLYPINIFKYKFASYFANSTFYILQMFLMLGIFSYFFDQENIYSFNLLYFSLFILSIIIAATTYFFIFSICEFLAFWFDNIWSLGVILRFITSFLGGGLIPLTFFPKWSQEVLEWTPFPYLIDLPMQLLLQNISVELFFEKIAISILWTIFFAGISYITWKKGNFVYSGVGI